MSFCRHVCRTAAQRRGSPAIDHVWVSDELVASTFASFVHRQQRHGSSIPGPCEARKRLAKRRNMDLAGVAGLPPGLDAALVFGFPGIDSRTRGEPSITTSPIFQAASSNPLALAELSSEPAAPIFETPDFAPLPLSEQPSYSRDLDATTKLKILLQSNPTLDEIRHIVKTLNLNLRAQPNLSGLIFKHILHTQTISGWIPSDINSFLEDPLLNPPGSCNFSALIKHFSLNEFDAPTITEHVSYLKRDLALGLIPFAELEDVITGLPFIKTPGGTLGQSNPEQLTIYYSALWNGLRTSPISNPLELETPILKTWLEQVLCASGSKESFSLCGDIIKALNVKGSSDWQLLSHVILRILDCTVSDHSLPLEQDTSKRNRLHRRLRDIWGILEHQDDGSVLQAILGTSESLVFSPQYEENRSRLLLFWSWMLQRMVQVRTLLAASGWEDYDVCASVHNSQFGTGLNEDPTPEERLFLRMWTLRILGQRTKLYYEVDTRRMELFEKLLARLKQSAGLRRPGETLTTLQKLMACFEARNLPYTDHVLVAATRSKFQKWLGIKGGTPKSMIQALNSLECGVLQKPEAVWDYDKGISMKTIGDTLLKETARETDITDPDFVRRILLYTETGASHRRGILVHLLAHHAPLKHALGKLRKSSSSPDSKEAKPTQYQTEGLPVLDPHACLNTINFIALVFAGSTSLSDRVSWRLTHWCYLFLRSRQAPILPSMSRALYHAGIQRCHESDTRVAAQRRKYVMDIVAETEGLSMMNTLTIN